MKFKVTAELMLSGYVFLREHGPLAVLPMPELVAFMAKDIRSKRGFATFETADSGNHCLIELSSSLIKNSTEALAILAHEMLHLAQDVGLHDVGEDHGPWFQAQGKALCRYHGWTLDQFGL